MDIYSSIYENISEISLQGDGYYTVRNSDFPEYKMSPYSNKTPIFPPLFHPKKMTYLECATSTFCYYMNTPSSQNKHQHKVKHLL